ncbi:hypothetical protein [Prevotella sp. Rep29]|uniref:hypothetical protein n=1 Tax=Prevotella sp. Rep29 TaxID=2691580 RepID=UPI001B42F3F5|nr:hypothetical protein [Prevotella sp. Rep29]MBP3834321.1 hypothetical protein [Prevotella sp.]QYR10470.1 hypothetical protein GRF55_04880 [Prevotella sp. Rep29]
MKHILSILLLLLFGSVFLSCRGEATPKLVNSESSVLEVEKKENTLFQMNLIRGLDKCIIKYYGSASTLGYQFVFELDTMGGIVRIVGENIIEKLPQYDYSKIFYYAYEICIKKKPIIVKKEHKELYVEADFPFFTITGYNNNQKIFSYDMIVGTRQGYYEYNYSKEFTELYDLISSISRNLYLNNKEKL